MLKNNTIPTFFIICLFTAFSFGQPLYVWELKQPGNSIGGPIDAYKFNTDIVYYGSNNIIYKSTDRGETFAQTGVNVPGASSIKSIILDYYNPGTFLVAIESSPNDEIYKTTDDGQTWTLKLNEGQMSFFGIPMERDPSHPDTIYTMVDNNFKRSTNFGDTWTTIASNFGTASAPCDIAVFPDTSIILIGDNGTGIFRSLDYGLTWSQTFFTFGEIPTISIDYTNPGTAWATKWAGGGGLLKSTDYGESWTSVTGFNGIDMWGVHVQPTDGNLIIIGCFSCNGNNSITWRSVNGGSTWIQINIVTQNYQIFVADSITQFAAQFSGFFKLASDLFVPVELTSFTAEFSDNGIILNWITATELNNRGFEIERSTDNKIFERIGFVPGFGTTSELKNYTYRDVEFNSGTQYYRLKQIDYDGTYKYTNAVEVDGMAPSQFSLYQNFPNPFNPSTSIRFAIPVDSNVKLKLFNMLGQEVAVLFDSEISAGIHQVDFSAKGGSTSGGIASSLSSGTYFYVLKANGNNGSSFSETKKMILIK